MAYIVSTTQTATAVAATYTVTLGAHQSGDLLLVKLSQDGGGTAIAPDATATTAGWAMIGTQAASGVSRSAWAFLIADSASEVNPTFTGANDDWIGTCLVIRDAHATAPFGTLVSGTDFIRTDWNNVSSSASGSLTSAVDECLLIYSWNSDGNTQYPICKLSELTCADKYSNTQIAHIVGYRQQQSAGAAPTVTMYSQVANEGGNGWVLAIRNKTGGSLQPDVRPGVSVLKWHGSWETQHDSITWQAPSSFAASINSITCSSTAPTVTFSSTQQQTPWGNTTALSSTEITAGAWVGGTFTITSANMTGKVFGVQFSNSVNSLNALHGVDGVIVGFSDGTNWATYQIVSKAKGWLAVEEDTAFVALGNATVYASSGSINWAAVTRIGYFEHRVNSVATAAALNVKHAALFDTTAITGGGASRPATFQDYQDAMISWGTWRWSEVQASAQVLAKASVQIGDGTNKTYFDGAAQSIEFPQEWFPTLSKNWQMDWNALASSVSLSVKASANDTIKLAAGAASTDTLQALTINSASSTSATYDFGQSFVGWAPIWKTGVACVNATFSACDPVNFKGATVTSSIVKNTLAGAAEAVVVFDESGATVTSTTLDVSGSAAGYHIELGASNTAITLTDVTFSGTPGTDKVHVLATTGTVTITISGTTALAAGDVTSAGATVVISAPQLYQSVTISNLATTSRVQIYDTSATPPVGSRELYNGVPGATSITWTDTLAAVASRSIRVRIADVTGTTAKNFIEANIGTCGVTSGTQSVSYLANQTNDTTYNTNAVDGSLVTGITFTDAATDLVNVNIASGNTTWQNIYAAFVYWISTAVGITDDIAYVDGVDPANYLLTSMKIKNTSSPSVPLTITGGFGRDATSGTITDIIDTTGGNIYPLVDHVVSKVVTVGGVNVITGDIADIPAAPSAATVSAQILADAATTPIAANIKQVNSLAVDGAGTEADPWGPQ